MTTTPLTTTSLEFGIYRDGDNNLDGAQASVIDQAREVSARNPEIAFDVIDTTARPDFTGHAGKRTESYRLRDGDLDGAVRSGPARDMSARATLAAFVQTTLDAAQRDGAKSTWLELVDHGGGDGGGLQTKYGIMSEPAIAGAIADGIAAHAKAHPEDADRRIDGVVANQCLMATLGFADALSKDGVKYLAASPETMLTPGVPTTVAENVVRHLDDPVAMAKAVVGNAMRYREGDAFGTYPTAAAFDVLDLDAAKIGAVRNAVSTLNADLIDAAKTPAGKAAIRSDARGIDGMARGEGDTLPWRADRPAIALYDTLANDARLGAQVHADAIAARDAIGGLILAHGESKAFSPAGGISYADAAGPTVHFPTRANEIDPWKPQMSETDNAFYKTVGGDRLSRALS